VSMTEDQNSAGRRSGRPRDASIDKTVLTAVRELLAEKGYPATTIQAISKRSGIPISSIYRRWTNRVELIEDAAVVASPTLGAPSGDLRRDLHRFALDLRAAYTSPVTRAAFPYLLGEYQNGNLGRTPDDWSRISWRPLLNEILAQDQPGSTGPLVDADAVHDLLLGVVLVGEYVPTSKPTLSLDKAVDLIRRLLRPD
jgi:AcrR family transcriptional regulator